VKERSFQPLISMAESFTPAELAVAPELLSLAALDASLFAANRALQDAYPEWSDLLNRENDRQAKIDKHLADSICILTKALRSNLSAYYAAIQEACEDEDPMDKIEF